MNLLQVVMTHKDSVETVARHLPIWEGITKNIIFASPEDSYMSEGKFINGYPEVRLGQAEHHGELSAQRIIKIFEFALKQDWEYFLLQEYDSFALALPKEVMPDKGGVSAALYNQNKIGKYKGRFYLHYPMLFDRGGCKKVYENLPRVVTRDRYFSDRFIGRAVEFAKIPVNDLLSNKKAFSKNTILPEHYSKLREAVKEGAVFFHGVKDVETLRIIMEGK